MNLRKGNQLTSDDSHEDRDQATQDSRQEEVDPGEVRVRFGKYGAALMMVIGFAYQAMVNSTQSHTSRITELGILMLVGFLLGWGFARIRF